MTYSCTPTATPDSCKCAVCAVTAGRSSGTALWLLVPQALLRALASKQTTAAHIMHHHEDLLIGGVLPHGLQGCFQLPDINGAAACRQAWVVVIPAAAPGLVGTRGAC